MDLYEELQDLMIKHHFRPSKKLSQFYCTNEALLRFLVHSAKLTKDDIVLEIGPGTGFLTKFLLEKTKVVGIEKDEIMIELLEEKFKDEIKEGKLKLIHGSATNYDYDKEGITKVVALPPYHLSSELMIKIATTQKIKKAIIVFDSGFVEKLTAFEGMREYNALTVLLNLNAKIKVLEHIDKASFFPSPNCLSVVVETDFNRVENSKRFLLFLKELFRYKNKDLRKALKQSIPVLKNNKIFEKEIDINAIKTENEKVYAMSPESLLEIFDELS